MTGFVFDLFHHAAPSAPDPRLDQVLSYLATIITNQRTIMASLNDIMQEVTEETNAEAAAIALIDKLHTELQLAKTNNDPIGMQAILDGLKANRNKLAAAVVAGTDATTIADEVPPGTDPGTVPGTVPGVDPVTGASTVPGAAGEPVSSVSADHVPPPVPPPAAA